MTDPVSNNTMGPSSSPEIAPGIVAAAGTQMSAPLAHYSNTNRINSLSITGGKDTGLATSSSDWSRLDHPSREYDAPISPYQAASTGASFYHSRRITHYVNPHLSSGLVGTTWAVASADQLQQDLDESRRLLRLAHSVNAPYMFHDYVEDPDRSREERQLAGRVRFGVPYGAVEVGSSFVPLLDLPASGILLPGNDHPAGFSFASVSARRRDRRTNAESLAVHFSAGDELWLPDAGSPRFGAGAVPGESDALFGEVDALLDDAAEHGHPTTDDGGEDDE